MNAIDERLGSNLIPVFKGKKHFYEVVEEIGDFTALFLVWLKLYTDLWDMPNIDFFAAFSLLLISLPLLFELHKWAMEEYCVGKYKNKEGGVLLVSKGFFSSSIKEMPITNLSPSISSFEYDYNIFYFIFRVFTGQRFQTVSIFSDTKFFLKTVRMDPGFAKAISTVKGHVPKQESGGFDSARLEGVLTSLSNGLIDKGRAQELAQIILES